MEIRALTPAEQKYTYAQSMQLEGQTSNIGHLRGDFASSGYGFYTTWFDTRPQWKTDEFKKELDKVINSEPKRYEYQHPAYQLVLADGGNGATGGRGNAVFGTCLATGERARWERYDVLGEIKPECMPQWAKEALAKIKEQQKEKKQKSREER